MLKKLILLRGLRQSLIIFHNKYLFCGYFIVIVL